MYKDYFLLLRVKQYVKNIFVLAPLFFAVKVFDVAACFMELKAFLAFCLASSFVYIFNDIQDKQNDQHHPFKRFRPIAAGRISFRQVWITEVLLLIFLVLLLWSMHSWAVRMVIFTYICWSILYTLGLKKIVIVDVFIIALGFILRVYAGALAIDVPVSGHIILSTLGLSMFLGFSKRKSEMINIGARPRAVIRKYSLPMLNGYIIISATLTIFSYFLYTLEHNQTYNNLLMFSSIFVIYGIFRYILLTDEKVCDDPTENLFHDKPLIIVCLLYVVYMIIIYAAAYLYPMKI